MSELEHMLISVRFECVFNDFHGDTVRAFLVRCVRGLHRQGGVINGHFGGQKPLCAIVRFSTS